MGLILKHVEKTKSGRWQYRRRVPKAVAEIIDKREFKRVLGDTEREALKVYPKFHAEVEQAIEKAKRQAGQEAAAERGELTERQAFALARARAAILGQDAIGATDEETAEKREAIIEALSAPYDLDDETLDPVNAHDVDRLTINILRNGAEATKRPDPTLEDAMKLYLAEKRGTEPPDSYRRAEGQVKRSVALTHEALGRDPVLTELTREEARAVRDHMLDQVKSDGQRISPESVQKYLNLLRAVINFAATEMDIAATFNSPFNKLPVPQRKAAGSSGESEKRLPLPPEVLKAAHKRITGSARSDLALIWRLLAGTGCRLSEIVGLRVEDVDTESDLPHIKIVWHEKRRVKTQSSIRQVPLVGDALTAAQEALEAANGADMLFPRYGRARSSEAVSAALMKHLRAITPDTRHSLHSLRHNMKDWLREAEVSKQDQDLILGHAQEDVGDRVYGGNVARLKAATRAMKKALAVDQ